MNLFRSEEHVRRWLDGRRPGATLPVTTLAALAVAWWGDRLAPDWKPRPREWSQELLADAGFTGSFWALAG